MKKLLEHYIKKNCRRLAKKNLEWKKQFKETEISYVPNGKAMVIFLIAGLIKKTLYEMSQYFPKLYRSFKRNIN